ncbi:MAG: xanthine dehydrogenase accessory protein XdhC [Maritimibacter sp.]
MSFDAEGIAEVIRAHGAVVRVVMAQVRGSAPRETGASMLIWADGQSGTIGGGTLEHRATQSARDMLAQKTDKMFENHKLGPELDQCCGGSVSLLSERFTQVPAFSDGFFARSTDADTALPSVPLAIKSRMVRARNQGERPAPGLLDGWFIEPVTPARAEVWIWGAGHVGRALIDCLAPLPNIALTWVDTGAARFPKIIPQGVTQRIAPAPADILKDAPHHAHHVVFTYSHPIDFSILDKALTHGFEHLGVIGSATKWARFSKHLAAKGHATDAINRIRCPIGDRSLGKHPQAIALGVAAQIIKDTARPEAAMNGDDLYDRTAARA